MLFAVRADKCPHTSILILYILVTAASIAWLPDADGDEVYPQAISKLGKISETVMNHGEVFVGSLIQLLGSVFRLWPSGSLPDFFCRPDLYLFLTLGHVGCLSDVFKSWLPSDRITPTSWQCLLAVRCRLHPPGRMGILLASIKSLYFRGCSYIICSFLTS